MKLLRLSLACLFGAMFFSACVKQKFDAPPDASHNDPMLPVNSKIQAFAQGGLNDLTPGTYRALGDSTFEGIVVGDDRSGNLYKKIIVEDTNGYGITIIIDKTYLYGDLPVGRRIYLKTNGLILMNYKGVPEIVYSVNPDNTTVGIPSTLLSNYIIQGSYPNTLAPKTVSPFDLLGSPGKYVSTLIQLDNMQFDDGSANLLYSSPYTSTNRVITTCDKQVKLTMYNSNYATFQSATTPNGNGSIVGIFTVYTGSFTTPEFILRDTTDVKFTNPRCP